MKYIYQKKVARLAKDLFDKSFGDWKACMKEAHSTIKDIPTKLIKAVKKSGEETVRVVSSWSMFNAVKGTGKKAKDGLKLFTDVAKLIAFNGKKNYTFSTYNVVSLY